MYSFFNAIRGNNTPNEYQSVLAVLKKVIVLQDCAQNEMDYDELYQLMESVATDFEIPNPFPEKERFVDIYRTLQGFDELSWTDILEYGSVGLTACPMMKEGQIFYADYEKPEGFCDEA